MLKSATRLLAVALALAFCLSAALAYGRAPSKSARSNKHKPAGHAQSSKAVSHRSRYLEHEQEVPSKTGLLEGGPFAFEAENYLSRAYPATQIPLSARESSKPQFQQIDDESHNGERGERVDTPWISIGPYNAVYPPELNRTPISYVASGRITALAVEPNCRQNRCRLYVGAAGGGIWRTNRAMSDDQDWEFISGSFATNAIGTITIDPNDPSGETIYVGTGEPNASADSEAGLGIYKTTDGGKHWSLLPAVAGPFANFPKDLSISQITIHPTNANIIYVSVDFGIRGVTAVSSDSFPPNTAPAGVYKSVDGGNTFTFIWDGAKSGQGVNAVALDPKNPDIIYAAAYERGVWRNSPSDGGVFKQVFVPQSLGSGADQTSFALTVKNGKTRMYAGDGSVGPPLTPSTVWRNDNMDQPASVLVVANTNSTTGGWKQLTSSAPADPGYATYNYCTGQCWYDNRVYTPAGQPDTVYVMGSFEYGEAGGVSNGRAVVRSTTAGDPDPAHNNRTFTDLTRDSSSNTAPNGIHPDQHAIAFFPLNPDIFFEGSDGGLMRSSGAFADISGQCAGRGLPPDRTLACQRMLSSVPTLLTSMNVGLNTLQFQSLSINPKNPTGQLLGGTQDNGTFVFQGSFFTWPQTIFGDGGQSGFNAANPKITFHTYTGPAADSNFHGVDPFGWVFISDPLFASGESSRFYMPMIADPNPVKGGTLFAGLQGVWRTTDNGGNQAYLEANCSEIGTSTPLPCGDWIEIASDNPTGSTSPRGRLGNPFYGPTRVGGQVAAITRAPQDTGTLWAATSLGRVYVSKNADAAGVAVIWHRIDQTAANSPGRFVSGIYVDPANSNHAWISYSGYNVNTPAQPGHVFEVTFDPLTGTGVWKDLDGGTGPMGDLPVTALVRDDPTGDVYAATDFGVLRLPGGDAAAAWQTAGENLPQVEVPGLSISTSARVLYAATHGRGAYALLLPDVDKHKDGHDQGHGGDRD